MMKHIRIGMVLFGMYFGFSLAVKGQANIIADNDSTGNDSLVHVAFRTVYINDLSNAISVLNPSDYVDKNYGTYPLDGTEAFVGGNNLWNIGNVLVLVDGVPRSVSDVTTSEIEQITYLKGANALVLYGSNAANGVLLITTKRGKIGDRKSNVYLNTGINIPVSYPKFLGSAEYMKYYNQACLNDGLDPSYDSSTISNYESHKNTYRYADVDYYSSDYLRSMFNYNRADADFSGGNDRTQFYTQAGFQHQNSLLNIGEGKKDKITRFNIRGNIDLKLNDYISTYVNMSNVFYDARAANGDYWGQSAAIQPHRFSPLVPIDLIPDDAEDAQTLVGSSRNIVDGKYLLGGSQEYLTNPISDAYAAGYSTYTSRQFQYNAGINLDLRNALKGLSFHGQMGIDYSNSYVQSIKNTYAVYVPDWKEVNDETDSITGLSKFNKDYKDGTQYLSDNWNNQVINFNMHFDYVNTFKEKHNVSAMILAFGLRGRQTGDFQFRTNTNLGLQVAYNYVHKYYVDFSSAVVNSTKLSSNKRVGFSPTINLGWVLSREDFLKGSNAIDRLKLSLSAGIINTDTDLANYFLYDENYSSTAWYSWYDTYQVNRATTVSRVENKNLTFSKRKEINIGIEGSLYNNLVDFRTNIFLIKKTGIPLQCYNQYPSYFHTIWPETSFVPYTNFNEDSYKGFDFQLSINKTVGEFNLTVGAAGTYIVTKALVRDELKVNEYHNRTGKPTDAIFGLENEGFYIDQEDINNHAVPKFGEVKPGDIKYKDQNADGVIDENDEVMIGHWMSPLTLGLHFTAQWKNFTLFVLGTGQFGGTGMKGGTYYWVYGDRKYTDAVRDSWTEETKNTATYPRLTTLSGDNNFRYSDFWTYSTNLINLSKIQLTYSVPDGLFKNSFMKGLNIYVSCLNLLTISKNKEIMELNVGTMPQTRFYNLGVKAVF